MNKIFLVFLNYFFFIFHTIFTIFNLSGWFFKNTRKLHLVTMILTIISWYLLGIWYGWGYCFCTDWHWKIRELLGYKDISNSYIHFLLLKLTRIDFPENLVVNSVIIVFFVCIFLSIFFNIRDIYLSKSKRKY